jgi:surface carbohydrate biosynthesis protein
MQFLKKIKLLLNLKITFSSPKKKNLIVFDDMSVEELKYVINDYNYFVLQTRAEKIKEIYFSFNLIFITIKNFRGNIFDAYLISLIEVINPKVIITFIDNSFRFYKFAKILEKKYTFLAIQNGARYEHKTISYLIKEKIIKPNYYNPYIPNFCCFGQYEVDDYKKYNLKVKNFFKVGSLRTANFLEDLKNSSENLRKKYDICYISEPYAWDLILNYNNQNLPMEERVGLVLKFVVRFCMENNKKLVLVSRAKKENVIGFNREQNFFKKYLTAKEFNFLEKKIFYRRDKFYSYKQMMQSRVVISSMSTMLRENLALKGKTLVCSYMPTDIFEFPIKDQLCVIKTRDYKKFEKRLLYILSIPNKKYFSILQKKINYMIGKTPNSTICDIKNIINFFINKKL